MQKEPMVFASVTYPSNKNIYTEYDYIQMYKQNNSLTVLVNKLHHTRRDIKYMIHNVTRGDDLMITREIYPLLYRKQPEQ